MFKVDTEDQLFAAFRPRDRKVLELSADLRFPLYVRDYVAWTHPAGGRVYLVFATPGGAPTGIAFQTTGGGGAGVPHMCDWCHCPGMGTQVGLLTAARSSRKRIGVHVCIDLGCQRKLEDEADRSGRSVRPAMERLVERMGRFAHEGLDIDLSGAFR